MFKYFRVFYIFIFLFLIYPTDSVAVDYYTENFEAVDNSNWVYYCNYGYTNPRVRSVCTNSEVASFHSDGSILLSTTTENFPVVISKSAIFPKNSNFSIRVKFRYPTVANRGVGLGVGFTGPFGKLFSQFGIWNDSSSGNNFKFYYNDFNEVSCMNFSGSTEDTASRQTITNILLKDFYWHYLTIDKIEDYYYVYLDRLTNQDVPIFSTKIRNNCIPEIIWFGNFISDAGGIWTTFSLDEILVTSEYLPPTQTPTPIVTPTSSPAPTLIPTPTSTPTPTQTPTPTPTLTPTATPTPIPIPIVKNKKIFILPGLGASWNSKAMVFNDQVDDKEWRMTPFVNNYDGLIELLNNNELKKDIDYFVWNYDWRKSLSEIEGKFEEYINSKNLDQNDEVYLVGHSLGGLVARLWASDNLNNYEIKEVVTLGSPHLGSLETYSVWNGAEVLANKGISSVAFKILLGLQNKSYLVKDLPKVRSFAPIMKDLLPVFDYASRNEQLLSWQSLDSKNENLYNKNQNINNLDTRLNLFVGVGYSTPSVLKLGKRTVFDKALGLWPDGQIINFSSGNGDGTVLKISAQYSFPVSTELNSDHGGIVSNSLYYVSEKLGLPKKNVSFRYLDNFSDSLIVFIGSPATGKLICGGTVFEEIEGFILAPNQNFNNCELVLSPTGDGKVHLVFGNTKNTNWEYLEKDVVKNETERLEISFSQGKIVSSKNNKSFLLSLIKNDLKNIGLNKAIPSLDKNDFSKVAAYVFKYRETHDEKIISQRILDNLLIISTINNYDKRRFDYRLIEKYINIIEKIVFLRSKHKPTTSNNAFAFEALQNFEEEVKSLIQNYTYPNFQTFHTLLAGYSKEALMDKY